MNVKRTSENLSEILQFLPDVWYHADGQNQVLRISDKIFSTFGFDCSLIEGKHIGKALNIEDAINSLHLRVKEEGAVNDQILSLKDSKGNTRHISISCICHSVDSQKD